MSRIFITGDIHGDPFRFASKKFLQGKELTKDDYVIIAGDFGILWKNESDSHEKSNLKWFDERKWTTLFVDGNHENHFRLNNLEQIEMFGSVVGKASKSVYHLKRGNVYDISGKSIFCFGGAHSTDIDRRRLGVSYWEEEVPNYAETDRGLKNLETYQYAVDYIITHTLPRSLVSILGFSKKPDGKEDPTIKYLDHIANCATFKKWYFGHMHINKDMGKFHALFEDIVEIK